MTEQQKFYKGVNEEPKQDKTPLIIMVIVLAILTCLTFLSVGAQELFRPGPYKTGELALDMYGSVWKSKTNITLAVSPPTNNAYWSFVRKISTVDTKNTPEQNSLAIEAYLNALPEGSATSIYIPAGEYRFARSINLYRKPINLYGDNGTIFGNSTKLYFPYNSNGINIDRGGQSIQETIIEKICLIGGGGDGTAGNGIVSNARIKLRDVTIKGFSQNGLLIWANMGEGGDASGSIIQSCHALENGHDGFFAGRVDASAITFINCDARNNGRYGFNDDSFLGNYYFGAMAHDNKAGHFFVRDKGNARTSLISCYGESGSPVNDLSPRTTVVGGFLANGYNKQDGKGVIFQ